MESRESATPARTQSKNLTGCTLVMFFLGFVAAPLILWLIHWPAKYPLPVGRPWNLDLSTGFQSVNGNYSVEQADARVHLIGDTGTLPVKVTASEHWDGELSADTEEVVIRFEFEFDPAWIGRHGDLDIDYKFMYAPLMSDGEKPYATKKAMMEFKDKTDHFTLKDILFIEKPRHWSFGLLRVVCYGLIGFTVLMTIVAITETVGRRRQKAEQIAAALDLPALRALRHAAQRRKARLWFVAMLVANALVGVAAFWGLVRTAQFGGGLAFLWTFGAAWPIVAWTRSHRVKHLRKAAGYSQPFADEILTPQECRAPAFALYLRCFDIEKELNNYKGVNQDAGAADASLQARPVENAVVGSLAVPLVGLLDPREADPMPGVHRFAKVPEDWLALVERLAHGAKVIVMHLTLLTPGILAEFDHLRSRRQQGKTLIIVGRSVKVTGAVQESQVAGLLAGFPFVVREQEGSQWRRAEERRFHARLAEALAAMEQQLGGEPLLRQKRRVPLTIPHALQGLLRFAKGPFITVCVLCVMLVLLMLMSYWGGNMTKDKTVSDLTTMLQWSPAALAFFMTAKGWFLLNEAIGNRAKRAGDDLAERMFDRMIHGKPQAKVATPPPPVPTSAPIVAPPPVRRSSAPIKFHVHHSGEQIGPFTEEEILAGVRGGRFSAQDLVWKAGTEDWVALDNLWPSAGSAPDEMPPALPST